MIFVLVYFRALKRKPVIYKSDVLFSLFSFSLTLSVFSFSSSIPIEKSQKIFLLPRKIFCKKKNFRASAKFYCGNETGNPERAVSAHLARSGSQSEHRIRLILSARGACHIISISTALLFNLNSFLFSFAYKTIFTDTIPQLITARLNHKKTLNIVCAAIHTSSKTF